MASMSLEGGDTVTQMRTSSNRTVQLARSGHEPIELYLSEVTPNAIARVFLLDPKTVWLKDELGGRSHFPNVANNFEFPVDFSAHTLTVHGCHLQQMSNPVPTPTVGSPLSLPSSSGAARPLFSSSTRKTTPSTTIKVVQAQMKRLSNGKIDFSNIDQTFIDIIDATANINYICGVIQRKWGNNYTIVTSDGLKIDDCSATQGLKFWKAGARKIFAVKENDVRVLQRPTNTSTIFIDSEDSDDDFELPPLKKIYKPSTTSSKGAEVNVSAVMQEIKGIRNDLKFLNKITRDDKIPVALQKLLHDTFTCQICQCTPITPPIIFSRCCKRIVGCQTCVDTWYRGDLGMNKNCPLCRHERGYSETTIIRGLDELMRGIKPIFQNRRESNSEDMAEPSLN